MAAPREIIEIKGMRETALAFRELPKSIGKNILRNAVASGTGIIRGQAKDNTKGFNFLGGKRLPKFLRRRRSPGGFPDRISGTLNRAIYHKHLVQESSDLRQTYYVSVRKGKKYQKGKTYGKGGSKVRANSMDAFYARFVEHGHLVVRRSRGRKGMTRIERIASLRKNREKANKLQIAFGDNRVPPYPFLRPAYNKRKGDMLHAVEDVFRRRVPIEAKKVGQRTGAARLRP